jgi:hypothetical protein
MTNIAAQLIATISNRRARYVALVAFAALIVLAAFLGADQTDD